MKLHKLNKSPEAKESKRIGRGMSSGTGKTSGRGHKGQKARSGTSIPAWFQGGQSTLFRRLPKRGFNNKRFEKKFAVINLSDLERFNDGDVITPEVLFEHGIIKKELSGIKVLGNGKLTKKVTVKAHRFSSAAVTKIEKAGGTAEVI